MKAFWPLFVILVGMLVLMLYGTYLDGHSRGYRAGLAWARDRDREELELHCYCGQTRSCSFGGGVVGIQNCDNIRNQWLRCEPNPQYCDNACLRMIEDYNDALGKQADLLNSKP